MSSKFYSPDQHRAEKVRELFATIANRYDLLNRLMSFGRNLHWKRRLAEMAGGNRGARSVERKAESVERGAGSGERELVLDLCCGTGDIAMMFAQNGACVTGVDFTPEMLQLAGARAAQHSNTPTLQHSISWVQADALRLPFPDNTFDIVSVGYGLRNLADLETGLREILRVLRPGGKLLSLDFGKPDSPFLRAGFFAYLRTVPPVLGWLFCGDGNLYSYIIQSLHNYPAQRGLKTLMEQRGYADCGFEEFSGGAAAINFGRKPL